MCKDDNRKHLQYFHNIEEMEWAIELALSYNKPVAATMCIGPGGDGKVGVPRVTCHVSRHVCQNTSPGECAARMARAGARLLGVNCLFDPFLCLDTLSQMRAGLEAAGGCGHVSRVTCHCPLSRHHRRASDGPASGLQDP